MFFWRAIARGGAIFGPALAIPFLIALIPAPASAAEIRGRATVIDAGTIEIGDARIRLAGIEPVAPDQMCSANGKPWNCGQQAVWALAYELAEHWLICRDTDATSGVCFVGGIHDVGETMVRKGWARADGTNYVEAETAARAARAGIWRSEIR